MVLGPTATMARRAIQDRASATTSDGAVGTIVMVITFAVAASISAIARPFAHRDYQHRQDLDHSCGILLAPQRNVDERQVPTNTIESI